MCEQEGNVIPAFEATNGSDVIMKRLFAVLEYIEEVEKARAEARTRIG